MDRPGWLGRMAALERIVGSRLASRVGIPDRAASAPGPLSTEWTYPALMDSLHLGRRALEWSEIGRHGTRFLSRRIQDGQLPLAVVDHRHVDAALRRVAEVVRIMHGLAGDLVGDCPVVRRSLMASMSISCSPRWRVTESRPRPALAGGLVGALRRVDPDLRRAHTTLGRPPEPQRPRVRVATGVWPEPTTLIAPLVNGPRALSTSHSATLTCMREVRLRYDFAEERDEHRGHDEGERARHHRVASML